MPTVTHNITLSASSVSQKGFGTPLIFGYHNNWVERTRSYSPGSILSTLVSEGFATTDPIYKAAEVMVAQSPRPKTIKVGRRDGTPTQTVDLTPSDTTEGYVYKVTIGGEEFTYTVQPADTVALICDGLTTAISGGAVAVTPTDNTTKVTVAADVAGTTFSYVVGGVRGDAALAIDDVTADATVATDIDTIIAVDDDWYALCLTEMGTLEIIAAAAKIQTLEKIMVATTQDSDVHGSGSSDVASTILALNQQRVALIYHSQGHAQMAHAAWLGRVLSADPGSINWAFKTLSSVTADTLTTSQISNLETKRCNYYHTEQGASLTKKGYALHSTWKWIDLVRGMDWVVARVRERIIALQQIVDKIPYTQLGIEAFASVVEGVLRDGERNGIFAAGTSVVTPPELADISAANKGDRILVDLDYSATFAGAVNDVTVNGTVAP